MQPPDLDIKLKTELFTDDLEVRALDCGMMKTRAAYSTTIIHVVLNLVLL